MLAMISFYRLPEFMMGPMANPFYHDLGLSKDAVGAVRASIGLVSSLLGIAAGGFSAIRFGYLRTMIAGLIIQSADDRQLRHARATGSRHPRVRRGDVRRQLRDRLRRRRAGHLHVER